MNVKLLAQRLYFIKPLLNFSFVAGIIFIVLLFIFGSIEYQNTYAIPCLLFAVWSLLFSATISLLAQKPSTAQVTKGWLASAKVRLAKAIFSITMITFIVISLSLLYVTVKILNL